MIFRTTFVQMFWSSFPVITLVQMIGSEHGDAFPVWYAEITLGFRATPSSVIYQGMAIF